MGQLGDILLECIGLDLCQRGMMDKKKLDGRKQNTDIYGTDMFFKKGYRTLVFKIQEFLLICH